MTDPSARVHLVRGEAGVTLAAAELEATFLPELGMLGVSLRHHGEELLALPGGLAGWRRGQVTGLPLLAPWANRLPGRRYRAAGERVDLTGLDLPTDAQGLPLHGTMAAHPGWRLRELAGARLVATFDYGAWPELLAAFPFPHELTMTVTLAPEGLTVATRLRPTSRRPVPVAFGYHPYLRLPGARRDAWRLLLPAHQRLELDERQLPTGASAPAPASEAPLGERSLDDHYRLDDERWLAVEGGGRRLTLRLDDGYPYAQVFAPAGGAFVCLEPMTAAVAALAGGGCRLVAPGGEHQAGFTLSVEPAREPEARRARAPRRQRRGLGEAVASWLRR